jgi:aminomethyltransferase
MVGFGGWQMPLSYPSGTIEEHLACRRSAAAFDVSHLGTVRLEGAGAFRKLQRTLSNDLSRIGPGRAQYSHLLSDDDGSVLDDVIVWWVSDEVFDVMPNASNTERVLGALGGRDVTADRALVAVQGPEARRCAARVAPEAAEVPRFGVREFAWAGERCLAAGTGYTGEDGIECAVPSAVATAFWDAVVEAGAVPAGLGARDTLRLEAGFPLHGHELGPGITPLQVGLGWVVGWSKGEFRGRRALEAEREAGPRRRLVGLLAAGRQPPREGQRVYRDGRDGREAGAVTSGNFSPCLGRGIALALVAPGVREGDRLLVEGRRGELEVEVVAPPFAGPGALRRPPTVAGAGARQRGQGLETSRS